MGSQRTLQNFLLQTRFNCRMQHIMQILSCSILHCRYHHSVYLHDLTKASALITAVLCTSCTMLCLLHNFSLPAPYLLQRTISKLYTLSYWTTCSEKNTMYYKKNHYTASMQYSTKYKAHKIQYIM